MHTKMEAQKHADLRWGNKCRDVSKGEQFSLIVCVCVCLCVCLTVVSLLYNKSALE